MSDTPDPLETTPTTDKPKAKKAKAAKPAAKKAAVKKDAKASKAPAPAKKAAKGAADKPKREKKESDVSTKQLEDSVVLKAVGKLKEPMLASEFAAELGIHRRVIRAQLQRLAKDKASGVKMEKKGPHWVVTKKA